MDNINLKIRDVFYIILLTLLAFFGNYFKYEFYSGIDIIFGSIFVMIIVIRYNILWAVLASFISCLITYYHWNHPYAIFYFIFETIFVSLMYRKRGGNIAIHDAIFWAVPGALLIFLSQYFILGVKLDIALSIFTKSAVNGTTNALIASFLFHVYHYLLYKFGRPFRFISFQNLTLELLMLMVIIPLVATIIFLFKIYIDHKEDDVKTVLTNSSKYVSLNIEDYLNSNIKSLKKLSDFSLSRGLNQEIHRDLQKFFSLNNNFQFVSVIDSNSKLLYRFTSQKDIKLGEGINLYDKNFLYLFKDKAITYFVSDLYIDEVTNNYGIAIILKIDTPDRDFYLVGFIANKEFESRLSKIQQQQGIHINLIDSKGRIIMSTSSNYQEGGIWKERDYLKTKNFSDQNIIQWIPEQYSKSSFAVKMRQSYLSKEQTLQYGWRLVVDYPMDELYHSITREANFIMSFIFIVMLISMSLAKSLNRITVDPIREIVSNTTNIAEKASSKVSFKQEIFFIKEFNQLISNYREAFEQILSYINEMKNRKILLEQEIELKTKKIITAEESYRKLSENMVDIIYRVNLTPVIKIGYINPAAERILGYSLKDYYDNPKFIYQIVHPDDRIKIKKHISQNYRNQSPYVFRFITNFGVTKWLELKDTFVYGENGKTIQIEGVARDVTDRQVLSELLNDSINQLQTIFDFAPDAILMVDMETGLIIDANQSASKLLDAKKIDIIGKHFLSIHPPELIEYARENFLLHSEGKIDYVHIDVLTSKGLQIPVEVITSKLKLKGRTIICVYIRDITIRQQYEEALKSSLKAKETLLSEVHHRVKNNFQVMLSLIDLKSMMTTDNSIKNILFDLRQRIMIMSLVHESLYHSDQIASHVDIQKYIYDLIDKLNIFYGRSNIVIQKFIDNININFEKAVQIGLIINEIITNSFKHAFSKNSDGRINVILIRLTENTAKLQISDNGKGLPEDFDISRLSSLGFELVKILSSQLNSTLDIESHEGLTITLIFPI